MNLTNDQYYGLHKLQRWYDKYQHQIIEISGVVGTGTWDLIQEFIDNSNLDPREVMYLSYDQKQVLDLAFRKYHSYYINSVIYKYTRIVDFNTLSVVNPSSKHIEYQWKKDVRKKIDNKYKLIVVFDSLLMNHDTINDLSSFGLPIILIRDPMLIPAPDTYTFMRDANIELHDIHEEYLQNPITLFALKVLRNDTLTYGSYDNVTVIPKKQMNIHNLRSSDMNITITDDMMNSINDLYREKILHRKNIINVLGERLIADETLYGEVITNPDNKKVKLYLTKGTVGTLTKVNKHVVGTKYVPIDFCAEYYHEPFVDLVMDRHYLNNIDLSSQQIIPDETIKFRYAYALTAILARLSHWDKVTLILDENDDMDHELLQRLLYTAITRARKQLTIIK